MDDPLADIDVGVVLGRYRKNTKKIIRFMQIFIMINKEFIKERLLLINSYLKELYDLSSLNKDEFISNKKNVAAPESFLRRILEEIFDIGRHILAKTGYVELSMEYKSIAKGLGRKVLLRKV